MPISGERRRRKNATRFLSARERNRINLRRQPPNEQGVTNYPGRGSKRRWRKWKWMKYRSVMDAGGEAEMVVFYLNGPYSLSGAHWREPAERLPRSKNLLHARMVRRYVCVARVVSRITKHAIGASDALAPSAVDTIARSVGSGKPAANEQAGKRYHQQGPAGGREIGGGRPRPRERRRRGQFRECAIGREKGEGATIKA